MLIEIKLLNGEEIEQTIDSNLCTIGRSSKCNIVVPHEGMSRIHCQIELINGDYFVTDLGSTNGVLIDGKKIEPNKKVPYQTYLTLSFGAVQSLLVKDDPTMAGIRIPFTGTPIQTSAQEEGRENVNSITITRTTKEGPTSSIKTPRQKSKKINQERYRTWAMNIVVILLIGGVVYWYMQNNDSGENGENQTLNPETPQETYDQF